MTKPFIVDDKILGQIENLAGYGLTVPQIAAIIGCSDRCFRGKKANEDRVLSAFEKGKAKAQGIVGKSLFERAKAGSETAIIWWEKTRAQRYGVPSVEVADTDGAPTRFAVVDPHA